MDTFQDGGGGDCFLLKDDNVMARLPNWAKIGAIKNPNKT